MSQNVSSSDRISNDEDKNNNNNGDDDDNDNNNCRNNNNETTRTSNDDEDPSKRPASETTLGANGDSHLKAAEVDLSTSSGRQSPQPDPVVHRLYRRRWLMVFLFASYSMTNNYQWIHLSIIGDKILFYYNASLPDSQYQQEVKSCPCGSQSCSAL